MVSSQTTYLLLTLLGISAVAAQIDWCQVQTQYCWGQEHIACSTNTFPTSTTCYNVKVLPMTTTLKDFILKKHNQFRQQIASGSNSKFPSASAMDVMQWDNTLQFLAETQVAHCTFQHDECRATPEYPLAGQNLYYTSSAGTTPNATGAVEEALDEWFNEWTVANPNIVNSVTWDMWQAFHFTVMVNDRSNHVGCGLLQYNYMWGSWEMDAFMLTCNYEYTNMLEEPVYTTGSPCAHCICSTTYPSLCAVAEDVSSGTATGGGTGSGSGNGNSTGLGGGTGGSTCNLK